jgi:photosystem II stability/assembly factor-like uncharacterized protein
MEPLLLLATENGVVRARRDRDGWHENGRSLDGQQVTSIIARQGAILAGTHAGIFRTDDWGHAWQAASSGLTVPYVRWLANHPQLSDLDFAGTEPAAIFVSHDGARSWRECSEVVQLRDANGWSLPYSPNAGCVRGFAFHGKRAYAAVEVGGVLRSDDAGETWRLAEGSDGKPAFGDPPADFIHADLHSIIVHPSSPDLVLAPTGGGFYRSADGGKTWQRLYRCYCRAAWSDPADANHILLGPADGVDRNGRIEETRDGGHTWQKASAGLAVPWRDYMVERFYQIDHELLAVLSNGQVWAAPLAQSWAWQQALPGIQGVAAIAWMPEA